MFLYDENQEELNRDQQIEPAVQPTDTIEIKGEKLLNKMKQTLKQALSLKSTYDTAEEDCKHAEHAKKILKAKPFWRELIQKTSDKYGISTSIVIAIIEMESGFNPNAKTPCSNALGLAQALPKSWDEYTKSNPNRANAERTDPRFAIDFVGWLCERNITIVNKIIDEEGEKEGFKQEWKLTPTDAENIYLAYGNGARGYLALRRYRENPAEENFRKLLPFQKRKVKTGKDKHLFNWEIKAAYAKRVGHVAKTLI